MRGRLLFALLFALGMWAALHMFSQTVEEQRTAAPMQSAVMQQAALPSEEKAHDKPQTSALQRIATAQDAPAPTFVWHALMPDAPYYRIFYQAFSLTNKAG